MHEVLVNRLGGLSLPRKSVVRLTDRPDMTLDVYRDVKQQINNNKAPRKAKIVYNFGLSECSRVKFNVSIFRDKNSIIFNFAFLLNKNKYKRKEICSYRGQFVWEQTSLWKSVAYLG